MSQLFTTVGGVLPAYSLCQEIQVWVLVLSLLCYFLQLQAHNHQRDLQNEQHKCQELDKQLDVVRSRCQQAEQQVLQLTADNAELRSQSKKHQLEIAKLEQAMEVGDWQAALITCTTLHDPDVLLGANWWRTMHLKFFLQHSHE